MASFHDNLTERSKADHPINLHNNGAPSIDFVNIGPDRPSYPIQSFPYVSASTLPIAIAGTTYDEQVVISSRNQYPDSTPAFQEPTRQLRVGDFDGDGIQDLFFASGAAWYFAPAGTAEWRLLSAKGQHASDLLFGDFDGDGRTDVVSNQGDSLMVSWGGVSDWEPLSIYPFLGVVADLQVGDFTGDQRDDLLWADGHSWLVSDHGSMPFAVSQTSELRVHDLRFGDFSGDGRTDVFGIVGGKWQISYAASSAWAPLPVSLSTDIDHLVVADFDGDGRADIAQSNGPDWMFSRGGAVGWTHRHIRLGNDCTALPNIVDAAAIGRFQASRASEVLWWQDKQLCLMTGILNDPRGWSRHPMR